MLTIEVPNLEIEIVDSHIWDFFNGKSPKFGSQKFKDCYCATLSWKSIKPQDNPATFSG